MYALRTRAGRHGGSRKPPIGHRTFGAGSVLAGMLLAAALLGSVGVASPPSFAGQLRSTRTGPLLPPINPAVNLDPSPDFNGSCRWNTVPETSGCDGAVLQAINRARSFESLPPLRIPLGAFRRLGTAEQLLTVVDLERQSRGLPPFVALSVELNALAQRAALNQVDPRFSGARPELANGDLVMQSAGNWAGGTLNTLAMSYDLMYSDGPGKLNITCTTASSAGCWNHRDNILARYRSAPGLCGRGRAERLMGVGSARSGSPPLASFTELFVTACPGRPIALAATWRSVQHLLGLASTAGKTVPA